MKEFLSQKKLSFTDKNIAEDQQALQELARMGYQAVPVTVIDGKSILGFEKESLEEALM